MSSDLKTDEEIEAMWAREPKEGDKLFLIVTELEDGKTIELTKAQSLEEAKARHKIGLLAPESYTEPKFMEADLTLLMEHLPQDSYITEGFL